jgi:type IV pilus assembly protein PilV
MTTSGFKHQTGFTLLEALIAFVILAVGLLGVAGLQIQSKQASYDAVQRSAALAIANDIVARIRSNDSANVATLYAMTFSSTTALSNPTSCIQNACSDAQLAAYDKETWLRSIRAADSTGSLANATVCISPTVASVKAGATQAIDLRVVVAWQGRQDISQSRDNAAIDCGSNIANRRMVTIDSYVYLRG